MQNRAIFLENKIESIKNFIKHFLRFNLPKKIYYHSVDHTINDVFLNSVRLAKSEKIDKYELQLLKIAALFHDVGFVERYKNNEVIAVKKCSCFLPAFGLNKSEIQKIQQVIMATKVTEIDGISIQIPRDDILQKIICDADLDNLGREDFFEKNMLLRKELQEHKIKYSNKEWYQLELKFLQKHRYFTQSAIATRREGKLHNLEILKTKAAKMQAN